MSLSRSLLDEEAERFAGQLTDVATACIPGLIQFRVINVSGPGRRHVGPGRFGPTGRGFPLIGFRRACDPAGEPERLHLKVGFTVSLDDLERRYLAIQHSTFGLWVQPSPERKPRPVVRVEYDRAAHSKPSSHVHLHAESAGLGWLYGTAGMPLRRLDEIHFPVGGPRFRPTLEDFLLFLDHERLFTDWATTDWRLTVERSRQEWLRKQTAAAVRRHPVAAVEELRRQGYFIAERSA